MFITCHNFLFVLGFWVERKETKYIYMERENEISPILGKTFIPGAHASSIQMSEDGTIYDTTTPKPHSIFLPASLHTADPSLQQIQPFVSKPENHHHFKMCNDPYCTTCSSSYIPKPSHHLLSRVKHRLDKVLFDVDKGYVKWIIFPLTWLPVVSHHSPIAKWWCRFFAFLLFLSISIDPLFFFILYTKQDGKCAAIDWTAADVLLIIRSITDSIYFLNILFQSRLSYIDPESTVIGSGESVNDPLKVAIHYCRFRGRFFHDLFIVLPIPQLLIWLIPNRMILTGSYGAKNILLTAVLIQYLPKLVRFVPLIAGKTPIRFIYESGWAPFVINLLSFMLAGHVVGSFWYLFGLQRIKECLKIACADSKVSDYCTSLILNCGTDNGSLAAVWRKNPNASSCFQKDRYSYGIYERVVDLSHDTKFHQRYFYSLFWGFQQISTLAGNQVPSHYEWEVLFTMAIIGLGLLLFALLIGNMQNFLLSFGQRKLEMVQRNRDIKQWMRQRCFPRDLKDKVQEAEQKTWVATGGIKEEMLIESLGEDLRRDIRRHLFKFLKGVEYFDRLDDNTLDAIRERLKPKTYLRGSIVLHPGDRIETIVFVLHGEMESREADGSLLTLSKGDVCGKELLIWFLDQSSTTVSADGTKTRIASMVFLSSRCVMCKSNVEAFTLSASDLQDVYDKCQVNHSAITAAEASRKKDC